MKRSLVVPEALRDLSRHLPPLLKKKVGQALEEILWNPHSGKALREELSGLHSYRIGKIRIIYQISEKAITLITIGPMETVYQKAALELKRQLKG